jgi:electron transfer flavoprotein alpha subunit
MSVLIFADSFNGKIVKSAHEAVSYGSKIAKDKGTDAVVLTYGDIAEAELADLGKNGADKVLHCSSLNQMLPNNLLKLAEEAVASTNADIVIFSFDNTGKTIAPMLSAKLKAGLVPGVIDFPSSYEPFTIKKNVFSGKAFAEYTISTPTKIISLLPNSVPVNQVGAAAAVEAFNPNLADSRISIKEVKAKGGDGQILLTEAELVVSAGRGMKGPENWGIVEEIAKELGAGTACSRPVADIGWRPHHEHVGQTGFAIRPNLYIAIGISGAIQHLAGVNGSKVIVVINKDPEAPFFKAADYGIVGDAFEVLPRLLESVKKFKAAS